MGYKLSYFNLRGLGEHIRLLLLDQGIAFEDDAFDGAAWKDLKPKMQFGQVPCLYDGEAQIVQSNTIMRHLGRKHGLYGESLEEATFVDMVADAANDVRGKYAKLVYGDFSDETKAQLFQGPIPDDLQRLNAVLTQRSKSGFILGEKVSYADYLLFELEDVLNTSVPGCLDLYAFLKGHHATMAARPNIAKRIADRGDMQINGNKNV